MTVTVNETNARVRLLVRQRDPARYLCALFAPIDTRQQLFALIAFHHELAQAVDRVSEPMLAHIRLAWWREVVAEISQGESRRHDVVESLATAQVLNRRLSSAALISMIDAREHDIEATQPTNIAEFIEFAQKPAGALAAAMLDCLGVMDDADRQAALSAATAWAMAGQLQSLAFHAGHNHMVLPSDVLAAHHLTAKEITSGRDDDRLRAAVAEISAAITPWLQKSRACPRQARPIGYLAILAQRRLKRFAALKHNPFAAALQQPDQGAIFALTWRAWTGR
jgi:phytoene synthase